MASPKAKTIRASRRAVPQLDPFRAWLTKLGSAQAAERCGVTPQAVRLWLSGRPVRAARIDLIQQQAKADGVELTVADLITPRV